MLRATSFESLLSAVADWAEGLSLPSCSRFSPRRSPRAPILHTLATALIPDQVVPENGISDPAVEAAVGAMVKAYEQARADGCPPREVLQLVLASAWLHLDDRPGTDQDKGSSLLLQRTRIVEAIKELSEMSEQEAEKALDLFSPKR